MEFNTSIFEEFPILKTERLTLRQITTEDAAEIFRMRACTPVNRFIARPNMDRPDAAHNLAQRTMDAFKNKQAIGWAAELRDDHTMIGSCGFNSIDIPNMHAEIGGELATEYWGKHIAAEGFGAIIRFGFERMNLHSIEAKLDPNNRSAIALIEAAGFVREGLFKDRIYFNDKWLDMAVYTLFREKAKFY